MERLPVALGLTPLAERSVEHALFGRDAVLEPRSSAADADDLERAMRGGDVQAVLLSPDLAGLTCGHCARIRARGIRIVGLAQDSWERQRLLTFGVDDVVAPADPEEALVAALRGPFAVEADVSASADAGEPGIREALSQGCDQVGPQQVAGSLARDQDETRRMGNGEWGIVRRHRARRHVARIALSQGRASPGGCCSPIPHSPFPFPCLNAPASARCAR